MPLQPPPCQFGRPCNLLDPDSVKSLDMDLLDSQLKANQNSTDFHQKFIQNLLKPNHVTKTKMLRKVYFDIPDKTIEMDESETPLAPEPGEEVKDLSQEDLANIEAELEEGENDDGY